MSSSAHNDNRNKDILILGEELTQGLDDTCYAPIFNNCPNL